MAIIKKKIWTKYFDLMNSGEKKYEFRLNDFDVDIGDTLRLEEWNPDTKTYTGRYIDKKVTHFSNFKLEDLVWDKKECDEKGFKIMSLE